MSGMLSSIKAIQTSACLGPRNSKTGTASTLSQTMALELMPPLCAAMNKAMKPASAVAVWNSTRNSPGTRRRVKGTINTTRAQTPSITRRSYCAEEVSDTTPPVSATTSRYMASKARREMSRAPPCSCHSHVDGIQFMRCGLACLCPAVSSSAQLVDQAVELVERTELDGQLAHLLNLAQALDALYDFHLHLRHQEVREHF